MDVFLQENEYIDYNSDIIQQKAKELFKDDMSHTEKAEVAFKFVRDEISHSFDINADRVTFKASDVLKYKTGICHAKSNLLAALLRSQGIKTGFCFQHLTLAHDESKGYCLHCLNAVFINNKWIKLDARGNKSGVNAQFSLQEPILAFPCRKNYDEYFIKGIFDIPDQGTMTMLEKAETIKEVADNLPDKISIEPSIIE